MKSVDLTEEDLCRIAEKDFKASYITPDGQANKNIRRFRLESGEEVWINLNEIQPLIQHQVELQIELDALQGDDHLSQVMETLC